MKQAARAAGPAIKPSARRWARTPVETHPTQPTGAAVPHEAPKSTPPKHVAQSGVEERRPAIEISEQFDDAYDTGLLDRARRHWSTGEWARLQEITISDISNHPDRARLALLAATGHHAAGDTAATRQYTHLALQWGCNRALVARALISGVHNTLARAVVATGRHRERALRHFEHAVAPGAPGSSGQLAMHTRAASELAQMGLARDMPALRSAAAYSGQAIQLGNPLREMAEQIRKQQVDLNNALKQQAVDLANVRKGLELTIKRETLNTTKQLEAFGNLQCYLAGGSIVPDLHGWPISPDFGVLLVSMLETKSYDLVLEMGSGASTLVIATALARQRLRRSESGQKQVVQVALEHLSQYHTSSAELLAAAKLNNAVQLVHSPLVPYEASNGVIYQYYECQKLLAELADSWRGTAAPSLLVVVDGPPAATGLHARYPAAPLILTNFEGWRVDMLLDDYNRIDEQQVAQMWISDAIARGLQPVLTERRLEKGACVLSF